MVVGITNVLVHNVKRDEKNFARNYDVKDQGVDTKNVDQNP